MPRRPTIYDKSKASAYCAFSRCRWGLLGHFFFHYTISVLSPCLSCTQIDIDLKTFLKSCLTQNNQIVTKPHPFRSPFFLFVTDAGMRQFKIFIVAGEVGRMAKRPRVSDVKLKSQVFYCVLII